MNSEVEILKCEKEDEHLNPAEGIASDNIYLPIVKISMSRNSISEVPSSTRQNIELLGECVCEALKRQQNFSKLMKAKMTQDFRLIMKKHDLSIPKHWFHHVRYEYELVLANKEEAKKLKVQNEIDLQEILTFCINKLEMQGKKKKFLTLEKKVKIIRTFGKVRNCAKLSRLYGITYDQIDYIMNNRDKILKCHNEISESVENISLDIILPKVVLKIRKKRNLVPDDVLKNIELLGECICEALKRQQNFSQTWINTRTEEFFELMKMKQLKIPYCWFKYVAFDFRLKFATEDEAQKETLPVEVDLHEILTFCINKMVKKSKEETPVGEKNDILNDSRCQLKSLNISTYSDVLKILNPIKDFAALCANNEGLEYISKLEDHIKNKINI